MVKDLKLYDRTKMLLARHNKSDKPVIIKGDMEKRKLYMVLGRTTFFSTDDFMVPNYYVMEYLEFLKKNNFKVDVTMKDDDRKAVRCFKARLKLSPNFDEKEIAFHESEIDR